MSKEAQATELEGSPSRTLVREGVQIEFYRDSLGGLILSAVVFSDSYLPKSVRQCVEEGSASLKIDAAGQRVLLIEPHLSEWEIERLLPGFIRAASHWRHLLNERGSRDLVPVSK